ncbi:hypothetical protein ACWGPD_25905 [Streptomyces hirsutus]|uniref:hypothetical protein n=1 Tax=Streptomyces hirsutus TaxID=35620 RepID=UPI0033A1D874
MTPGTDRRPSTGRSAAPGGVEHDDSLDQGIREHINTARTPAERCRWVRRGAVPYMVYEAGERLSGSIALAHGTVTGFVR